MSSDPEADVGADVEADGEFRSRVRQRSATAALNRLGGGTRTLYAVVGVAALALLVRVVGLGGRVFHWDEGRVGYWILRYRETGEFFYRPIIHGPFLPIVDGSLFSVLPPSDFAARLPVAVVGGLLPLAAWLFRDYLRDDETVALALLFALNPLLVYYSRFMRGDVLVAAFSVFALGFLLRGAATGDARYLYPSAASLALGFATKENALLYLACYLGAAALVFDHRLLAAAAGGRSAGTVLFREWPRAAARRLRACAGDGRARTGALAVGAHALGALVVFFAVVVFFYAPRPEFWAMFAEPTRAPSVVETATVGSWEKFASTWASGSHQDHDYVPYLYDYLETLLYGAPALLAFALVGFVADRYGAGGFRNVVTFAVYWGLASVVGYPMATDIQAPWAAVHAVVPLAIPAAVGVAAVVHAGRGALAADDAAAAGLAALIVLVTVAGVAGANVAYWNSTAYEDREVLQYAQPGNGMQTTLEEVRTVAAANEGTDVLFFGTCNPAGGDCDANDDDALFYVEDERSLDRMPPGGPSWHSRLPLPWYMELYGAEVASSPPSADAAETLRDPPPVVVAYDWNRSDVEPHLDGYEAHTHRFRLWSEHVVVFVDESALRSASQSQSVSGSRDAPAPGAEAARRGGDRPATAASPKRSAPA